MKLKVAELKLKLERGYNMRIGIIAAMEPELDILRDALLDGEEEIKLGISFYPGMIGECEVVLALSGVGKVNSAMCATLLISEYECNFIINTGIAGGMKPLKTRDVIIGTRLCYHDFDTTIFGYSYGQVPGCPKYYASSLESILLVKKALNKLGINYKEGTIYSGDQFVSSCHQLEKIGVEEGSLCEMEGASIAQVCVKAGVEFVVLRYISDIIGDKNQIDDYLKFESDMANRSSKICLQILNNLE